MVVFSYYVTATYGQLHGLLLCAHLSGDERQFSKCLYRQINYVKLQCDIMSHKWHDREIRECRAVGAIASWSASFSS